MNAVTNANFDRLVEHLRQMGEEARRDPKDSDEYKRFIKTFPPERLTELTLAEYCVGKGDGASFCWWLERGLQPVLGRYMPGTSRGHILYFRPDGTVYKHGRLADLPDDDALRYTLRMQRAIADVNWEEDPRWIDDDEAIYRRARVEPRVTVGEGRKLRLLASYHPDRTLPISSSAHLGHYLEVLGYPSKAIPPLTQAVARLLLLRQYYENAAKDVPGVSPYGFMRALYGDALGLAPVKDEGGRSSGRAVAIPDEQLESPPLNQILYGPPGTGKTYATINHALAILAPDVLAENSEMDQEARARLKTEFDQFVKAERVRFVTFHQSFSYEDFVEGLRADVDAETGQVKYTVEAGVFKKLCDDARIRTAPDTGVRANPAIWKISIAGTGSSPTKTYCLDKGEARIGWGKTGDLRENYEQNPYYQALGSGDKGTLSYFAEQMTVGDILLCIHSAEQIGAIGVVTSDYRYENQVPIEVFPDYQHVRSVRWLHRDIDVSILPLNNDRQFTLKTVYAMNRFTWADLLSYLQQQGVEPPEPTPSSSRHDERYVLIIDEINRGNISRIFGELITLIEPSKRDGADEALTIRLPYSKKTFSVPNNVYIIGTMNTADRSLAGLDIALRRRFVFQEMPPRPHLLDTVDVAGLNIGQLLRVLNQRIEVLLDRDHCLGHAYFMPLKADNSPKRLESIFRNQILPLLQEYFFEDWERISWVLNDHQAVDKGVAPFIQRPGDEKSLTALFGSTVAERLHDQRWEINTKALGSIDSYRNILG